jgi:hypothetical protein
VTFFIVDPLFASILLPFPKIVARSQPPRGLGTAANPLQRVRLSDNELGVSGGSNSLSQRISFQDLVWRGIHSAPAHGMSLAVNALGPPRKEVRKNERPALLLERVTCR